MKSRLIIGGGIVGLATAYKLLKRNPGESVTLVEKEPIVGSHQSTRNSGVLHCGLYYKPGSLKAQLSVEGIQEMVAFCQDHDVAHEVCGKLVVATNELERSRLADLFDRGAKNGLAGLEILDQEAMKKVEPHIAGVSAIKVPQEGIVDYRGVCDALAREIQAMGGVIKTVFNVSGISRQGSHWVATSSDSETSADYLINCAGLHCDRIARIAGARHNMKIVPFRGEYYRLSQDAQSLVSHLIYPVPDPAFPFLGVHFTRLIHGGVEAGPNAVLAFKREGYAYSDISFRDLWDSLSYSGFWNFMRRYPTVALQEFHQSLSIEKFCRNLQKLIPEVRVEDLDTGGSGVRAQAMLPNGQLEQDFHLIQDRDSLHLLNAPSPAATASLAIAGHIVSKI
ncbi:MAG: L-2-hydroxyglutarate oxidase [Verrucomicrobiota bacterium]